MGLRTDAASNVFTFDFVADLLKAVKGNLTEIRVEKTSEGQVCGVVVVQKGKKVQRVKADIQDALSLAVYTRCPIFVAKDAMQMLEQGLATTHEVMQQSSATSDRPFRKISSPLENLAEIQSGTSSSKPRNLDFGEGKAGWHFSAASGHYEWDIIPPCREEVLMLAARLISDVEEQDGVGALFQGINPDAYRGKRLRLSATLKAQEIEGWGGLWLRVDGLRGTLAFDNMHDRHLHGTQSWQRYEVVVDVPEESIGVTFGMVLVGKGRLWMRCVKMDVVGQGVALMDNLLPETV